MRGMVKGLQSTGSCAREKSKSRTHRRPNSIFTWPQKENLATSTPLMDLLGLGQEKPLPPSVIKRQAELLTRIDNTKMMVPVGIPASAKFLAELDDIANTTLRNDRYTTSGVNLNLQDDVQ